MRRESNRLPFTRPRAEGSTGVEYASKRETAGEARDTAESTLRALIESLPMGLIIANETGALPI
jgi:hypothetical protein